MKTTKYENKKQQKSTNTLPTKQQQKAKYSLDVATPLLRAECDLRIISERDLTGLNS